MITDPKQNHDQALRRAAASGSTLLVKQLIQAGASLTVLDGAPLRWAVRHRRAHIVRILLRAGAPWDAYWPELLTLAATNGDPETLKLLLTQRPRPHEAELLDRLLPLAVKSGNVRAAQILLADGANAQTNDSEPLHLAACGANVDMMQMLLQHGADVRGRNSQALFDAVYFGSAKAVRFLLGAGVSIHDQNGAPLQLALMNGDAEIAEILIEAGVPMSMPDWVVHCASCDSIQTLELLLGCGYNLADFADDLVAKSAQEGGPRVVKYVLAHAKPKQSTLDSALEPAVRKASGLVVQLLLAAGANPSADSSAALRVAIQSGELPLAHSLLDAGANVADLQSSAISEVASFGDYALVIRLLRGGVTVAGCQLVPLLAHQFCLHVAPEDVFRDQQNHPHPEGLRRERLKFAQQVASQAAQFPETEAVMPTLWLSRVLEGV